MHKIYKIYFIFKFYDYFNTFSNPAYLDVFEYIRNVTFL